MKEFLKKLLKARTDRMNEIRSAIDASNDVNEVRNLTKEATALQAEINDLIPLLTCSDLERVREELKVRLHNEKAEN